MVGCIDDQFADVVRFISLECDLQFTVPARGVAHHGGMTRQGIRIERQPIRVPGQIQVRLDIGGRPCRAGGLQGLAELALGGFSAL